MGVGVDAPAVTTAWSRHLGDRSAAEAELAEEAYREMKRGGSRIKPMRPILPSTLIPFDDLLALWAGPPPESVSIAFTPPGVPAQMGHLMCLYMSCVCTFGGSATSPQAIEDAQKAAFAAAAAPALRGILADALAAQDAREHAPTVGADCSPVSMLQAWRARVVTSVLRGMVCSARTPVLHAAVLELLPFLYALLRGGSCGCPGRLCVNSGTAIAAGTAVVSWVPAAREMMVLLAAWLPRDPRYARASLEAGADVLSLEEALDMVEQALDLTQELVLHHVCVPGLSQVHDPAAASSVAARLRGALWQTQGELKSRGFAALFERTKVLLAQLHPFRSPYAIRMYTDLATQTIFPPVSGDEDVIALNAYLSTDMMDAFGPILQLLAPPGEVHPDIAAMLMTLAAKLDAEQGNRMQAFQGGPPVDKAVTLLRGAVFTLLNILQEIVRQHMGKKLKDFPPRIMLPPPVQQRILTVLLIGPFADRVWLPYARAPVAQAHLHQDWQDPTQEFALEVACLAVDATVAGVLPQDSALLHGMVRLLAFGCSGVRGKPAGISVLPYIEQLASMIAKLPAVRMDDLTTSAFAALRAQLGFASAQAELLRSAWMNDAVGVRVSVEAGADPDATMCVHPLVAAAAMGNAHAVQAMLTPPVIRLGAARQERLAALQYACAYGHVQVLRAMIDTGMVAALAAEMPHHHQSALSALALHAYGTDAAPCLAAVRLPVLPEPVALIDSASIPIVHEHMPALSALQAACLCGDATAALVAAAACGDDWDALCSPSSDHADVCAPMSPLVLAIVSDALDVVAALLTLQAVRAHINDATPIGDNWAALHFAVISQGATAHEIVEHLLVAGAVPDQHAWQLWSEHNSDAFSIGRLLHAAGPPNSHTMHVGTLHIIKQLPSVVVRLEALRLWRQQAAVIAAITVPEKGDSLLTIHTVMAEAAHYVRRKHALRHRMWTMYVARPRAPYSTAPTSAHLRGSVQQPSPRLRFGALRVLSACKSQAACATACEQPRMLMMSLPPASVQHNMLPLGREQTLDATAFMGVPRACAALADSEQRLPLRGVWRFIHSATGASIARAWMVAATVGSTVPFTGMLAMDCVSLALTRLQAARAAPALLMGPCILFVEALVAANPSFITTPCAHDLMYSLAEALPDVSATYEDNHGRDVTDFLPIFAAGNAQVRAALLRHLTSAHSSDSVVRAGLEALAALARFDGVARSLLHELLCKCVASAVKQPPVAGEETMRSLHMLLQRAGWAAQVDGCFGPCLNAWTTQMPTSLRSRVLSTVFELRQRASLSSATPALAAT